MAKLTSRPVPRTLFLQPDRRARIYFYTSNLEKSLQARLVFERYGLGLSFFRTRTDPYEEDYTEGSEQLLQRAIEEIRQTVASSQLFFVEDTSIRIAALSGPGEPFPGLAAKEWFAATTFDDLDAALREAGNDRRATVCSDIALHVPGLRRAVLFHGETQGRVADTPPTFSASIQYPWLTPDTFNGWFIPDGCERRLGEMSLEESWRHDFRIRALVAMVDRLEEYAAMLNLPASGYSLPPPPAPRDQTALFGRRERVIVVIGRTCAGKSTFGDYVSQQHALRAVEASGIVRMMAVEAGEEAEDLYAFAEGLLRERGPTIIAERALKLFEREFADGLVLTGLRTVEEVEFLAQQLPGLVVVNVDADERIRYERFLRRGTRRDVRSLEAFRDIDNEQLRFGLLRVAQELADVTLVNEGSLPEYFGKITALFGKTGVAADRIPSGANDVRQATRLARALRVLVEANVPMTADEVARTSSEDTGRALSPDGVNEVFRASPELVEITATKVPRRYVPTRAGIAFVSYLRARDRSH